MKNVKGITLIALVITIIVMLILVGVTINVVIQGGLFDTANTAKVGMTREVAREKLISAMVGAYDGNGNFVKGNVVLPEGMSWDTENSNCVIADNNEKFYIDPSNGAVLDEEPTGAIDKTKAYNISFKDLSTFSSEKWDSIFEGGDRTEWIAFYPANLTVEQALSTNNYACLFWDHMSDGYCILYKASGGYSRSETNRYDFIEAEGKWFYNETEISQMVTMTNVKIVEQSFMESQGQNPLSDDQLNAILNIVEVTN